MIYTFDVSALANFSSKFTNVKHAYIFTYSTDKNAVSVKSMSTGSTMFGTCTNYGTVYTFTRYPHVFARVRVTEKELLDILREATVSNPNIGTVKTDTVREYMIGHRADADGDGGGLSVLFAGTYTKDAARKQIETWTVINPTSVYFLLKIEGTAQYKSVPSVVWS